MADFNALVADVITITNRADLLTETQQAVKSATLQLHRRDFFAKDLQEFALEFATESTLQSIDTRTLFPRFRSMKYIRKFSLTGNVSDPYSVENFYKAITPEQVLDSYNCPQVDIWYAAGDSVHIRSKVTFKYATVGIYLNPEVSTPETYRSWISDEAYFAVVYLAASLVFGNVLGDSKRQGINLQQANMEAMMVLNSNITSTGS